MRDEKTMEQIAIEYELIQKKIEKHSWRRNQKANKASYNSRMKNKELGKL